MSATEVIQEIQRLPPTERRKVQAYLLQESRSQNPTWQAELARRIDEARAGRALNSVEIQALVAQARAGR